MKILIIFFLFSTCIKTETLDASYEIYLCIGQSNMAGWTHPLPSDTGSTAYLFTGIGWEKADGALNRYSTISTEGAIGLTNSFGKEMALRNHKRLVEVGLVVNAKKATTIEQWRYDGLIDSAIVRTHQALRANPRNKLKGILWHQGESNAVHYSNYMTDLEWIADTLQQEFGNVPFVLGQLSEYALFDSINKILLSAPNYFDCRVVINDGLNTLDGYHFDNPSAKELGIRYANAITGAQ